MSEAGVQFRLKPVPKGRTAAVAALSVAVDGEVVWPVPQASDVAMEIPLDDLLSHFVEFWEPLALRQTYPIPVSTARPLSLRASAESRWEAQPAEVAEREDAALCDFEEAHDVSRCFSGYFDLPPLWLLRRGSKMVIDTRAGMRTVDFDAAWREIVRLGGEIASRLEPEGERWARLIGLWRARDNRDPLSLLAWSTGLSRSVVQTLLGEGKLSEPASFADAADDSDELRIAARMASALPPEQIGAILSLVSQFPKYAAPALDALAGDVSRFIDERFADRRAHEQGELAAHRVRDKLGLGANDPCDIADVLEKLGVRLEFRAAEPATLRALAIDGRAHGPIAFVNMKGVGRSPEKTPRENWSARVDLAHELCHLLLDRGHALGAVEILNSRMPIEIEQRAKSFAGELLAPTAAVEARWRERGALKSLSALKTLSFDLQQAFGVTRAVASWKLEHAARSADVDISRLLDQIAPNR